MFHLAEFKKTFRQLVLTGDADALAKFLTSKPKLDEAEKKAYNQFCQTQLISLLENPKNDDNLTKTLLLAGFYLDPTQTTLTVSENLKRAITTIQREHPRFKYASVRLITNLLPKYHPARNFLIEGYIRQLFYINNVVNAFSENNFDEYEPILGKMVRNRKSPNMLIGIYYNVIAFFERAFKQPNPSKNLLNIALNKFKGYLQENLFAPITEQDSIYTKETVGDYLTAMRREYLKALLKTANYFWNENHCQNVRVIITNEEMCAYYQEAWHQQQILSSHQQGNPQAVQILQALSSLGDRNATAQLISLYQSNDQFEDALALGSMSAILKYATETFNSKTIIDTNTLSQALEYYTRVVTLISQERKNEKMERADAYTALALQVPGLSDLEDEIIHQVSCLLSMQPVRSVSLIAFYLACLRANIYISEVQFNKLLQKKTRTNPVAEACNLVLKTHWILANLNAVPGIEPQQKIAAYQNLWEIIYKLKQLKQTVLAQDSAYAEVVKNTIIEVCREVFYQSGKVIPANTLIIAQRLRIYLIYLDPQDLIRDAAVLGHRLAMQENTDYRRQQHPHGERLLLWSGTCDTQHSFSIVLQSLISLEDTPFKKYPGIRALASCCKVGMDQNLIHLGENFIHEFFTYLNAVINSDDTNPLYRLAFDRLKMAMAKDKIVLPIRFEKQQEFVWSEKHFKPVEPQEILQVIDSIEAHAEVEQKKKTEEELQPCSQWKKRNRSQSDAALLSCRRAQNKTVAAEQKDKFHNYPLTAPVLKPSP
jgi:hypothetical protein